MLQVPPQAVEIESRAESQTRPPVRLLLVDDDPAARAVLSRILQAHGFDIAEARSVAEARARLVECRFDIVLLDLIMPDEGGQVLLGELAPLCPRTIVIVLTGVQGMDAAMDALRRGAYDYLRKPVSADGLLLALESCLRHREAQIRSEEAEERLREAVARREAEREGCGTNAGQVGTALLRATCGIAEARGPDSEYHLRRLSAICREIVSAMPQPIRTGLGITDAHMDALSESVVLHDIGQIGIPDDLLLRPGPLDPGEYATVRRHPELGKRVLERLGREMGGDGLSLMDMGCGICAAHHERFDGAGYPSGLCADEIPVPARIVAVADFYDTATHPRPYRALAFPHEEVIKAIQSERERAFDPFIVDAFLRAEARIAEVSRALSPPVLPAAPGPRTPVPA